jgi:hypothetical protein
MLTSFKTTVAFLVVLILWTSSCEKDPEPEEVTTVTDKVPPVAVAGSDRKIFLADQMWIYLDGSSSYDNNGGTLLMKWKQTGGPATSGLVDEFKTSQTVQLYEDGDYEFELTVTDRQGNVDKDTVAYDVEWASCLVGTEKGEASFTFEKTIADDLPTDVSYAANPKYLVFAGGRPMQEDGWGSGDLFTNRVYIYDFASKAVVKQSLAELKAGIGIAMTEDLVFFAGGAMADTLSDMVEIYNIRSNTMTRSKLSKARAGVCAIAVGSKVIFAGGANEQLLDVVDIYDIATNTWSTTKLPESRAFMSAVSLDNKVYFAGGFASANGGGWSLRLDIYDVPSGQWISKQLSSIRENVGAQVIDNKIAFTGRAVFESPVSDIDFYEPATGNITTQCAFSQKYQFMAVAPNLASAVLDGKLYQLGDHAISRYDAPSKKWTIARLPQFESIYSLVSDGKSLYALKSESNNDNSYLAKVSLLRVSY